MYLETIYILSKKSSYVRSIDVGEYMGYSKPSVSRAVSILKKGGYVLMDDNGHLTLTDTGLEIAQKIYERHTTLTDFLIRLGVNEKTAAEDACKMEHDISDETFAAMKKHAEKYIAPASCISPFIRTFLLTVSVTPVSKLRINITACTSFTSGASAVPSSVTSAAFFTSSAAVSAFSALIFITVKPTVIKLHLAYFFTKLHFKKCGRKLNCSIILII